MNRGITKENMLFALPPALKGDTSTEALAAATAEVLADRLAEMDRLRIVPNIDNLEEALLAILARDFKVDWYDPDYSIEEKRRTVKSSWRVHKTLGTKAAVETAIRAIYPGTRVLEWWEYGGEPYHFRLDINITTDSIDSVKQRRVLERMNFYKSLRRCDLLCGGSARPCASGVRRPWPNGDGPRSAGAASAGCAADGQRPCRGRDRAVGECGGAH